jgi:hypothetical protein
VPQTDSGAEIGGPDGLQIQAPEPVWGADSPMRNDLKGEQTIGAGFSWNSSFYKSNKKLSIRKNGSNYQRLVL